jgi:hypothetical protein
MVDSRYYTCYACFALTTGNSKITEITIKTFESADADPKEDDRVLCEKHTKEFEEWVMTIRKGGRP